MLDEKSQRYDRQLRLWGTKGQSSLENARICVINANATSTETLKNLVLPGVGHFTIVDNAKITSRDLGTNFFITSDSIGKPRAEITKDLLLKHNPNVIGEAVVEDPRALINEKIEFFEKFTLIIVSKLERPLLVKLAKKCWDLSIPLISIKSVGFIGYLRIISPEHTVIETKPENPPFDFRINDPFPSLLEHCNSIKMEELDEEYRAHVPYVIILVKAIQDWKQKHDGKLPKTRDEQNEFKKAVYSFKLRNEEYNVDEAFANAYKAWAEYSIPSDTQQIIDDEKCNQMNEKTTPFWVLARAVRDFVKEEGKGYLPLLGTIPDMTADTNSFLALQKVYKDQANREIDIIQKKVVELLEKIGKKPESIEREYIELFCKNVMNLQMFRFGSLAEELDPKKSKISRYDFEMESEGSTATFYLYLQSSEIFNEKYGRYPGENTKEWEKDVPLLKEITLQYSKEFGLPETVVRDAESTEFCRYGNCELHNIAAIIGGITAQESIKLLTSQLPSLDNTFIFNGTQCSGLKLKI
ncbi:nedd8-activating enzyme e1 regulatory subunit [Anaeramoeba ignava]|uniref:NEDD8-activating enzyme E1 regulatory subunit n=1 Tax=Anaeramoeba ignava TaxID=1746090 RepID=A0A9Q0L6E2_ANAIG|nr:nedd8-activating enzyme e1 regulatory subunit [Anaeramoeba ignava]|eukprot:Anaeramoba_ignava/a347249_353.p2 GENE.a347249_353~~a347249_353.p2  ORF type:complete len:536 (-),score=163.12 a347249_353:2275-3852(-)